MSATGLLEVMDQLGSDEAIAQTLFHPIQVKLRSKGLAVEEIARSLAHSFAGAIDELMDLAELVERNTRFNG